MLFRLPDDSDALPCGDYKSPTQSAEEKSMSALKTLMSSAVALVLIAGPAAAVTVKNTSGKEISFGIDYASKGQIKKLGPGQSVTFECKDGCGVTGPWGFSWMAKGNDTISTNGKSLVTTG
jgi:uncharacterized membrane protein